MSTETELRVTVGDGIGEIRFCRPQVLNAISVAMGRALDAAVDRLTGDPSVRVIVLSGEGRAFMAGGDLTYFHTAGDKAAAAHTLIEAIHPALLRLSRDVRPVLASLQGAVAGGGMGVALSADLAIAADDVKFSLAYLAIAANPDCGSSWNLVHTIGLRKAMGLALLGDTVDGEEALRLGLVNRLVPAAELEAQTRALALRLATQSVPAMGRIKALLRRAATSGLEEQMAAEQAAFIEGAGTADFAEGLDAFLGKRKPSFAR